MNNSQQTSDDKGPVEILCHEIAFDFNPELENMDILFLFVSVLVGHISDMRNIQVQIVKMTNNPPSDASGIILDKVRDLLKVDNVPDAIDMAAAIHTEAHTANPDEFNSDKLIDLLSSCVSAIRFGLELPCHSRHAASAAGDVFRKVYGIGRYDGFSAKWQKDWIHAQMHKAVFKTERVI